LLGGRFQHHLHPRQQRQAQAAQGMQQVHAVLTRLHFYRLVWHRALFNVALYAVLLGTVDHFCRSLMLP